MFEGYHYTSDGRTVTIHYASRDAVYNEASIRQAISNVRAAREHYATETAWNRHLEKLQGALDTLLSFQRGA